MSGARFLIREATPRDAAQISTLVIATLRQTNARHYPKEMIERIIENFSVANVAGRFADRTIWVALTEGVIIGTAGLEGSLVRSVFVEPAWQGHGIGAALMAQIHDCAATRGYDQLTVPASVNARGFYERLGFRYLRDEFDDGERIVVMTKRLGAAGDTDRTDAPA